MNRRKIQKVLNSFWQSGDNLEKEIIHIDDEKDLINDLFALHVVGSSVWLIQEKNTLINYGLFNSKEKAEKYINGNKNFAICEVFIK